MDAVITVSSIIAITTISITAIWSYRDIRLREIESRERVINEICDTAVELIEIINTKNINPRSDYSRLF